VAGCCGRPPAADCWRSCCVSRRVPGLQQQHCHTDLSNPSWWSTGCVIDGQFVAVDVLACLMWGALSYQCSCVCVFGPWACCMLQPSRLCCCLAGSLKMARLSKVWLVFGGCGRMSLLWDTVIQFTVVFVCWWKGMRRSDRVEQGLLQLFSAVRCHSICMRRVFRLRTCCNTCDA
jgi:hypothetical protein